ncbi:MAG: AbrB/MazE/SpoVT family DNA-binding domain-containing protein [Kiritimatiellaeota bacterium]|nr:AbrB/MazE/SpoVT family DNA-binding domain-containing protein [Kiritimatiellota bacterium]
MDAIVGERGQVTIPKPLRERLGIGAKTVLDFEEENGRLVATKLVADDPVTKIIGRLRLDRPTDELIAEMRGDA